MIPNVHQNHNPKRSEFRYSLQVFFKQTEYYFSVLLWNWNMIMLHYTSSANTCPLHLMEDMTQIKFLSKSADLWAVPPSLSCTPWAKKAFFFFLLICICKDYHPNKSFHVSVTNAENLQLIPHLLNKFVPPPKKKRFLSESSSLVFVYRAKALMNGYCNLLHFDTELVPFSCSFSDLCLISSETHFPFLIKYNNKSCSRLRRLKTWFFFFTPCVKKNLILIIALPFFFLSNFHFSW